jgi:hypothetical protein
MSRYRRGSIALLMLAVLVVPDAGRAEPFVPDSDALVLDRMPAAGDDLTRQLRDRRAALARNPDNLELALSLAAGYVRLGRREADPRYDGYAQAALAPWWNLAAPPIPVLLLRATLAQRRHDFAGALADLERVLAQAPRHPRRGSPRQPSSGSRASRPGRWRAARGWPARSSPWSKQPAPPGLMDRAGARGAAIACSRRR